MGEPSPTTTHGRAARRCQEPLADPNLLRPIMRQSRARCRHHKVSCSASFSQYQASPDFQGLADSTRRSYVPLIKRIEKAFGDFPLTALDRSPDPRYLLWPGVSRLRYRVGDAGRQIMLGLC